MRTLFKKGLIAASVSALLLVGTMPDHSRWENGASGIGQAYAAGGKGRGASGGGGHDGSSHEGSSHSDDSHSSHDDDHDDHDHDDGHDDGHDSSEGKKGKGPRYRGGREASSKGRGGPGRTVVEKIFEGH